METNIQRMFRDRFPELPDITESFDVLEQWTKTRSMVDHTMTCRKIVKIMHDGTDEDLWDKLIRLREEINEAEWVALHRIKHISLENLRKMTESIFQNTNTKVVIYTDQAGINSDNRSQGKAPERKTYALVVDTAPDKYMETLKTIKESIKKDAASSAVKNIKSTKEGKLLITVEKGKQKLDQLENLIKIKSGQIRIRKIGERNNQVLHIRGIDADTKKDEVKKAIEASLGVTAGNNYELSKLRPNARDTLAITLRTNSENAEKLLQLQTIRIGVVNCDVSRRLTIKRCQKCWRSREAQDLLYHSRKRYNVEVLLVSEPNIRHVTDNSAWTADTRGDTTIRVYNGNAESYGRGNGLSWCVMEDVTIFSCYKSPNSTIAEFEAFLEELTGHIRDNSSRRGVLVTGNFNAKNQLWGSNTNDIRGSILTDWLAVHVLIVVNTGGEATFVRGNQHSVIELTLASADLADNTRNWRVLEDESLSDHQLTSWRYKAYRADAVAEHLQLELGQRLNLDVDSLTEALRRTCKTVLSGGRTNQRKPVYWWSEDIATLRKSSICKKRRWTRLKAIRNEDDAELELSRTEYRAARKELRTNIRSAKYRCWDNIVNAIDDDVWGDGHRIACKRTGVHPRLNLSTAHKLEAVDNLFPRKPVTEWERVVDVQPPPPITTEEIAKAADRLKPNKAPGPDGILPEVVKMAVNLHADVYEGIFNEIVSTATIDSCNEIKRFHNCKKDQIIMQHCAMVRIFSSMCGTYAVNQTEIKLDERLDSIERQIQNISSKSPISYSAAVSSPAVRPPPRRSTRVRLPSGKTVTPVNKSVIILKPTEGNQSIKTSDDIKKALVSNLNPRNLGIKLDRMSRAGPAGLRLESLTSDLTKIPADDLAKAGLSANFPSKLQLRLAIYNVPSNLSSDELLRRLFLKIFLKKRIRDFSRMMLKLNLNSVLETRTGCTGLLRHLRDWSHTPKISITELDQVSKLSVIQINLQNSRTATSEIRAVAESRDMDVLLIQEPYSRFYATLSVACDNLPPIKLKVEERVTIQTTPANRKEARTHMLQEWQYRWARYDGWAKVFIKDVKEWTERKWGEVDYHLSQAFTWHGVFGKYLQRIGKQDHDRCWFCDQEDTAGHTLFLCKQWTQQRQDLYNICGTEINKENVARSLLECEENWNAIAATFSNIMKEKEAEEYRREAERERRQR
ncbi:hypothetical protein NQ314_011235 [Rhamnusium bicolor]|uniref:Endonuclease/exonuclease/phosphatase domain-containing protein n=1 Tax=Rhamnusium bicolor TaxID=1586634 RepID=A0AAV8XJG1_9CUCU|nr:hypothetical protein NQ314_011235 [Rhamnusium bicolor]